MKWLFKLNKEYFRPYLWTNILLIFFDSIGFIDPILIGLLCDNIIINHNYHNSLLIALVIVIFTIVRTICSYFLNIKLDVLGEKITSKVKAACYENINKMDYYFFEHNNKGELMTNFTSDMSIIRRHLTYNIKTIGTVLISFFWSLGYLLHLNFIFTIVLLTPGFVIGFISYKFVNKMKNEYEILRDKMSKANDYVSDNIEGNRVVKSFALEKYEIENMTKINEEYINKDMEIGFKENRFYAKVDFLSWITNTIFLLMGGYFFINGHITLGNLIIFNSYLYNLRAPFTYLSSLLNSIERFIIAQKRVNKLISAEAHVKLTGKRRINNLLKPIELKNVQIIYDDKIVTDDLNLKIEPLKTTAFIGKTGSGKSSIAKLLLGLITPTEGKVLIGGENYFNYDIKDIRAKIGYMAQQAFLFSDTIMNNINYGNLKLGKKEAYKYADIACCDYIYNLPEKIDTVIGEKGVGLSGGEKGRLALARGLAVDPDILLLDDITSALDIETEEKINHSIKNLKHKCTKIIIAGKIVSVKDADIIYVLDNGKIIEQGTHNELLKKKGYYYDLYKIQKGDI